MEFLKKTYIPTFKKLFKLKPYISPINRPGYNIYWNCRIESKEVYEFLQNKGFTIGRKAKIAKIPNLPRKLKKFLLAGLLDTDGGKKGSGFGFTTASPYLAKFCEEMFKEFKLSYHSCPWRYNNHTYHQIYIHKKDCKKILNLIPIKNQDKIDFIKCLSSSAG